MSVTTQETCWTAEKSPSDMARTGSPCSSSDHDLEKFSDVLHAINLDYLPRLAERMRGPYAAESDERPTVGEAMHGSFNIVYPIHFSDGHKVLVKIPINGTQGRWDGLAEWQMMTEVNTMRLLRRETTIPLPRVFGFCSSANNELHCPYIIISFIPGRPLYEVWDADESDPHEIDAVILHQRRVRALQGVASAMFQLDRYNSKAAGSLIFDEHGALFYSPEKPSTLLVGPTRRYDMAEELIRRFELFEDFQGHLYTAQCPTFHAKDWYCFTLDFHPRVNPYPKGIDLILRWMIHWIPEPAEAASFVLAHPDLNSQNILVSEEGEVQGIIDWDGVCTVPRSVGNRSYPMWLVTDWDPEMESQRLDTPGLLEKYRAIYRNLLGHLEKKHGQPSKSDLTRRSVITLNLASAAADPKCRNDIVIKVLRESLAAISTMDETDLDDLVYDFPKKCGDGEITPRSEEAQILRAGFLKLLQTIV